MPDLRDVLDREAPDVGELDVEAVRRRGHRRRIATRAAVTAGALAAVALLVVAVVRVGDGSDSTRRIVGNPPVSSTVPSTTTTSAPTVPAYVDPSPDDPALRSDLPRCSADDLAFARKDLWAVPGQILSNFYFFNRAGATCALVSYPIVEGLTQDGTWEEIPVYYRDMEAVSSFPWEGVIDPESGANVVTRLESVLPSFFVGERCPATPLVDRHYSGLRFHLREGGSVIELPGAEFDVTGCATVMLRFGHDSRDGPAPGS